MIGSRIESPMAIQNRCLIACLRMSLSWSMVAVAFEFGSTGSSSWDDPAVRFGSSGADSDQLNRGSRSAQGVGVPAAGGVGVGATPGAGVGLAPGAGAVAGAA